MGAFGLRLPTLGNALDLLVESPLDWPAWNIAIAEGHGQPTEFVRNDTARIRALPSGWVDVQRRTCTTTLHLPKAPHDSEIAQPHLSSTAVVVAHWRNLNSFHAGALVVDGRAWGMLGHREAGKSSMLAALSLAGVPILTDDILVVADGSRGLAGPRCADLRIETARALGIGQSIGLVGTRERWRIKLGYVDAEVPLGGWVTLEWGTPNIRHASVEERIDALFANLGLRAVRHDPAAQSRLMDLIALPMICFRRPRALDTMPATADRLYTYLGALDA